MTNPLVDRARSLAGTEYGNVFVELADAMERLLSRDDHVGARLEDNRWVLVFPDGHTEHLGGHFDGNEHTSRLISRAFSHGMRHAQRQAERARMSHVRAFSWEYR